MVVNKLRFTVDDPGLNLPQPDLLSFEHELSSRGENERSDEPGLTSLPSIQLSAAVDEAIKDEPVDHEVIAPNVFFELRNDHVVVDYDNANSTNNVVPSEQKKTQAKAASAKQKSGPKVDQNLSYSDREQNHDTLCNDKVNEPVELNGVLAADKSKSPVKTKSTIASKRKTLHQKSALSKSTAKQYVVRSGKVKPLLTCHICLHHTEIHPSNMARHVGWCQNKLEKAKLRGSPVVQNQINVAMTQVTQVNEEIGGFSDLNAKPITASSVNSAQTFPTKKTLVCKYCSVHTEIHRSKMARHTKKCRKMHKVISGGQRTTQPSRDQGEYKKTCVSKPLPQSNLTKFQRRSSPLYKSNASRKRRIETGRIENITHSAQSEDVAEPNTPNAFSDGGAGDQAQTNPITDAPQMQLKLPNLSLQHLTLLQRAKTSDALPAEDQAQGIPKPMDVSGIDPPKSRKISNIFKTPLPSGSVADVAALSSDSDSEEVDFVCPYQDFQVQQGDKEMVRRHLELHCWYCPFCEQWTNGFQNFAKHYSLCKVRY